MEQQILKYDYKKGKRTILPTHNLVKNWSFIDEEEHEAILANAMAEVAEKNGLTINDLSHLFPAVLRMLKSKSNWCL